MKLMIIEADAEEMRANRTIFDNLADCVNNVLQAFTHTGHISASDAAKVLAEKADSESEDEEENGDADE